MKQKFVCKECGSEDILKDAFAEWCITTQSFELRATYDAAFCQNEEGGCTMALNSHDQAGEWIDIPEPEEKTNG